jgi:hypothetical protein
MLLIISFNSKRDELAASFIDAVCNIKSKVAKARVLARAKANRRTLQFSALSP